MITEIIKRDGRRAPFQIEKITDAIYAAAQASGGRDREMAERLAEQVVQLLDNENMITLPTVLLAGDKMLTEDSKGLHPKLKTVAVKDGFGAMIRCLHPKVACDKIRQAAEEGLKQDLTDAVPQLPEHFVFELSYKEHKVAAKMSAYPGCKLVDDLTVRFESDDFMEVLRCGQHIM